MAAAASVPAPIRVLIADDRLFAEMLMTNLSADERIDVIGTATTGEDAVELMEQLQPHVLLLNLRIPVRNGAAAARRIRRRGSRTRLLVLSGPDSPEASTARSAGADGFVSTNQAPTELTESFFQVASLSLAFSGRRIEGIHREGPLSRV
jgi:two-component system, NarL family, nitrate/nitrite response regulator NarL